MFTFALSYVVLAVTVSDSTKAVVSLTRTHGVALPVLARAHDAITMIAVHFFGVLDCF